MFIPWRAKLCQHIVSCCGVYVVRMWARVRTCWNPWLHWRVYSICERVNLHMCVWEWVKTAYGRCPPFLSGGEQRGSLWTTAWPLTSEDDTHTRTNADTYIYADIHPHSAGQLSSPSGRLTQRPRGGRVIVRQIVFSGCESESGIQTDFFKPMYHPGRGNDTQTPLFSPHLKHVIQL